LTEISIRKLTLSSFVLERMCLSKYREAVCQLAETSTCTHITYCHWY